MTEEKIQKLLKKERLLDIEKELIRIYPNGFDINTIDTRIRDRMKELTNKYYCIEKPIQLRRI